MKSVLISIIFSLITSIGLSQNKTYISTRKAIEDIDYMIKSIEEIHYNPYFKIEKKQCYQNKNELVSNFNKDSISLKNFVATGMKLAAQMSRGHTSMDWQNEKLFPEIMMYKFIPFTGKISIKNKYLTVTHSANQYIKKGVIVESINGVSIGELYTECLSYIGGIESFKHSSLEKVFPLYLFFTDKISAPYSLKLSDSEIEIPGIGVSELNTFINQSKPKENYIFEITNDEIGLITYNSCTDYDTFKEFIEQIFKEIKKKNIKKLIIDIRENSGGDSRLNDLLLPYISTKPYQQSSGRYWKVSNQAKLAYKNAHYEKNFGKEFMTQYYGTKNQSIIESFEEGLIQPVKPKNYFNGKTCILIGPSTFSSANFLADAVKIYKLSTLIGLPTGELTNDFGELINFTLPNSSNYVYVSSTYDIGANGNSKISEPVYPDIQIEDDALFWIK